MLNILITGANSYIGRSFAEWASRRYPDRFRIESVSVRGNAWRERSFAGFDAVLHVAGLAHADLGSLSEEQRQAYFTVNRDLGLAVAEKAKRNGVKQFVFMSSMLVYGDSAPYGQRKVIGWETVPRPANCYGESKLQAEEGLRGIIEEDFRVAVVRPPMIYGPGCKGNYRTLARLAKRAPVFPDVANVRSMLFIDNLSEFLCRLMLTGEGGVYFPQNREYVLTSEMVREIAAVSGHRIWITGALNWAVALAAKMPGKVGTMANKAFGSLCYAQELSECGFEYRVTDWRASIARTERG